MGVEHRMHSCLQECRAQAHRFVKQVEREKIRQQEGLLGSLSWCHSSLRSVNTSLLWSCWRVSYCIKGTTPSCFWMERNSKGESTRTEEIVIFWFCSLLTTTKWCYIGNLFFLSLCFIKHIQEINWLGSRDWDVKNCTAWPATWCSPWADHFQDCSGSKQELYFFPCVSITFWKTRLWTMTLQRRINDIDVEFGVYTYITIL